MGQGPDAVVDQELRVHGEEALCVVSGSLIASIRMITSCAGDWILGTSQVEPFAACFAFRDADPD